MGNLAVTMIQVALAMIANAIAFLRLVVVEEKQDWNQFMGITYELIS